MFGDVEVEKRGEKENETRKSAINSQSSTVSTDKVKPKFSESVPVASSVTQKKEKTRSSNPTDLTSLFGDHSDDEKEEMERKKQDTTIKVNRQTNIHYAVHRNGEK